MNVRKSNDYSALFERVDAVLTERLPQMKTYRKIGRLIAKHTEKGAATAVAEYLRRTYPDTNGFSPRNVRRMREFYRTYENEPVVMRTAMEIGWTQNVVILEANLTFAEKAWYICTVRQFGWSKLELTRQIVRRAHEEINLDTEPETCYTVPVETEEGTNDKNPLCVSREHLSQSDGGIRDERHGTESRTDERDPCLLGGNNHRGDRQPGLSSGTEEARRARHQLRGQDRAPAALPRLRAVRPDHWHGSGESRRHASHLPWRPRRQDPSADGLYRPPRRCCRPLVHTGFRGDLAQCRERLPGTVGTVERKSDGHLARRPEGPTVLSIKERLGRFCQYYIMRKRYELFRPPYDFSNRREN